MREVLLLTDATSETDYSNTGPSQKPTASCSMVLDAPTAGQ